MSLSLVIPILALVQTFLGIGNGVIFPSSSRHFEINRYVTTAFDAVQREMSSSKNTRIFQKQPGEAVPMFMVPNFHQLVAYPGDEVTVMKQVELAKLQLKSIEELRRITGLSAAEILSNEEFVYALHKQFDPICKPVIGYVSCDHHAKYRTINGTCNNLKHPEWGSSDVLQRRYLQPVYQDGLTKPRMLDVYGDPLPSPRKISNAVFRGDRKTKFGKDLTVNVMSFGQFIDHEFISTPVLKKENGSDFKCCGKDRHFEGCIPIQIPRNDPHFNTDCMSLVRSAQAVGRTCSFDVRQQLNRATSYLDGSAVYGNNEKEMNFLRQKTGGLLKVGPYNLLPESKTENCMKETKNDYCQAAGDGRANVVSSLGSTHTVFMREHNRIANELSKINPHWNDERIFQESKKIVSALLQHITYTEYLPIILGDRYMHKLDLVSTRKGFSNTYDPKVNAGTTNVFGAVAFRFGHTQIPNIQAFMRYSTRQRKDLRIEQTFHRPTFIQADKGRGCRENLYWLLNDKQPKADRILENGIRDFLFLKDNVSLDLGAVNIQRARDHGVPSYNEWRRWCNLPVSRNFYNHYTGLVDHKRSSSRLLRKVYRHADDIDLFAGALSEKIIRGSQVGPTFACIIGRQFRDFKYGDRFWYERYDPKTGFTLGQLNSIKAMTFSKLICQNANLPTIQPNAFLLPSRRLHNEERRCSELPGLDLSLWRENVPRHYDQIPFGRRDYNIPTHYSYSNVDPSGYGRKKNAYLFA